MIIASGKTNMCQGKPRAFARSRTKTTEAIFSAKHAATVLPRLHGRFEIYNFLKSIYLIYRSWKRKTNCQNVIAPACDQSRHRATQGNEPNPGSY
jgi:hypothetical protein